MFKKLLLLFLLSFTTLGIAGDMGKKQLIIQDGAVIKQLSITEEEVIIEEYLGNELIDTKTYKRVWNNDDKFSDNPADQVDRQEDIQSDDSGNTD